MRPVRLTLLARSRAYQKGRQQQQRQFRRVLRTHAQSSIVMSAIWTGLNHRLKSLMGKMGRFSPETSFVDLGASNKGLDAAALADVSVLFSSRKSALMVTGRK